MPCMHLYYLSSSFLTGPIPPLLWNLSLKKNKEYKRKRVAHGEAPLAFSLELKDRIK